MSKAPSARLHTGPKGLLVQVAHMNKCSNCNMPWACLRFCLHLLTVDFELMEQCRRQRCPRCGAALCLACWPRKPGGLPAALSPLFEVRFGLCCCAQDCRCRVTPPSVRFAGRKQYVAPVYLWACLQLTLGMLNPVLQQKISQRSAERWRAQANRLSSTTLWSRIAGLLCANGQPNGSALARLDQLLTPEYPTFSDRLLHMLWLLYVFASQRCLSRAGADRAIPVGRPCFQDGA